MTLSNPTKIVGASLIVTLICPTRCLFMLRYSIG